MSSCATTSDHPASWRDDLRAICRPHVWVRAVAVCSLVLVTPVSIDSALWWRSPRLVSVLDLSPAQAREVERIYRSTLSERLALDAAAREARVTLRQLLTADASEAEIQAAAELAAGADGAANVARNTMLYRMFRVLSAEQRTLLSEAREEQRIRSLIQTQ